jgi:signal transduction histidine kinase
VPVESVQRVVVHDKLPLFDPEPLQRPVNRLLLGVAALALIEQGVALGQVIAGHANPATPFDFALFAFVALLWLGLGILVFIQRRGRRTGQLFLLAASFGSVFVSELPLYNVSTPNAFLFTLGLLVFPPLILLFARAYYDEMPAHPAEPLLFVPAAILIWPGTSSLVHPSTALSWKLVLVSVGLFLVAAAAQAWYDLGLVRSPAQAAQTRTLLFGLVAGTAPGIVVFVVPIVATNSVQFPITWVAPIILLFLTAMGYSVLLFEFTEADLIIRRGVVYGVLTAVIIVAYGGLGLILTASRNTVQDPAGGLSFVVVTVLIGAAFPPLTYVARRLVDWVLYGRKSDRWTLLQELTSQLSRVMPPEGVVEVLVQQVVNALNLRGAFLLRVDAYGDYRVAYRVTAGWAVASPGVDGGTTLTHDTILTALGDPPAPLLVVHAKPMTASKREEIPDRIEPLDTLDAALSIPLITRSGLEAVLCLQPKQAHDAFDSDDLELLAPVMRQATAALDNALLFARLEAKVDELRVAYLRIAREQEAERGRLARELHDGTAQELAGLITLATVAERQLGGEEDPARSTLDRLKRQAEDAYQGVRRASHALRPLMLDDFGLVPTLARYLEGFSESTQIAVDFDADDLEPLPSDAELALYRVAQECMENVRKHSGARRARVEVRRRDSTVVLDVQDEGMGLTANGHRGIGLAGMRERVEAVGGTMHVWSNPGRGVHVQAVVPAEEEA